MCHNLIFSKKKLAEIITMLLLSCSLYVFVQGALHNNKETMEYGFALLFATCTIAIDFADFIENGVVDHPFIKWCVGLMMFCIPAAASVLIAEAMTQNRILYVVIASISCFVIIWLNRIIKKNDLKIC